MRILIIEDNEQLLENLYGFFETLGYQLDSARSGYSGLALAADSIPALGAHAGLEI